MCGYAYNYLWVTSYASDVVISLVYRFTAFFAAPHVLLQEGGLVWIKRDFIIKWVWLNAKQCVLLPYCTQDDSVSCTDTSCIVFSPLVHVSVFM